MTRHAQMVAEYRDARYAWEAARDAECHGYETDEKLYALDHPPVTFKSWLQAMGGSQS